ncbi:MAG: hypothetical protein ACYSUM_21845 [Planctomycetota bacterium]
MRDATVRSLALLPLLLAVACSTSTSTRSSRIEKNKELFATYPPDVQAAIRSGEIRRGFDQKQVYMAFGKPSTKDAQGTSETWLYEVVAPGARKKTQTGEDKAVLLIRMVHVVKFTDGRVSNWEDPPGQFREWPGQDG